MDKITQSPTVSVIIPSYNYAHFLPTAIESVLSQSVQNLELIIIDNGSTDNTKDIIEKIDDPRIRYYYQDNSGSPASPRNKGMALAKGDYIAFLDSDDAWLPGKLEYQLAAFQEHPDSLAVATGFSYLGDNTNKNQAFRASPKPTYRDLLKGNLIVNSSMMIKKEACNQVGTIDEDPQLLAIEDYDYWLRLLHYQDQSIYILDEVLTEYRIHDNNLSMNNLKSRLGRRLYLFNKHLTLSPDQAALICHLKDTEITQYHYESLVSKQLKLCHLFSNSVSLSLGKKLYITSRYILRQLFWTIKSMLSLSDKTQA